MLSISEPTVRKVFNKFAWFPLCFISNQKTSSLLWLEKYQLKVIDCAHGEILKNGKLIGKTYWDH